MMLTKKFIKSFQKVDINFFVLLLIIGLVPSLYKTIRIFYLGYIPSDWGFNIASQLSWVNVIYEVIQEGILIPLFYLIGKSLSNRDELSNKIRTGFLVTFFIYTIFSAIIFLFAKQLIIFMNQKDELIQATVIYIKLETVASVFFIVVKFLLLVLIIMKKNIYLYIYIILQTFLSIVFDTLLISKLPISLDLGVNGIAIGNIVSNIILLCAMIFFLRIENIYIGFREKLSFLWFKEWIKVGGYSGLESLVRNTAFIVMILQMINSVGKQDTFWVANTFIWGWLLLPVIQLGQLIKRDCGEFGYKAIEDKTFSYFNLTCLIVLIWIITIPFWGIFIEKVMNINTYKEVLHLVFISMFFYILFSFNNIIDSIFYGIGKTNYMLFQSIFVNVIFYGSLFFLYLLGVYKPTLNLIAITFGLGIAFDSVLTFIMFIWFLKKNNIKISY